LNAPRHFGKIAFTVNTGQARHAVAVLVKQLPQKPVGVSVAKAIGRHGVEHPLVQLLLLLRRQVFDQNQKVAPMPAAFVSSKSFSTLTLPLIGGTRPA
jgi:hypothetical protein